MTDDARAPLRGKVLWPLGTAEPWIVWLAYPWIVFQLAFSVTGWVLARWFHIGCEVFKCQT